MFNQKSKSDAPSRETRGRGAGTVTIPPAPRIPSALRAREAERRGDTASAERPPSGRGGEDLSDPLPFDPRADEKRLIVGKGILLKGEISSCDRFVVEGRVEADLIDSEVLVIAEGGEYRGTAVIEEADISGVFEGTLTVAKRIMVRSTGRINGEVRYGELEIERGGRISGDVQPEADQPAGRDRLSPSSGR